MEAPSQPLNGSLDYGHPLEFGYFLTPDAGDPLGVLETARLLDRLGYDLVGVQDHPYQPRHLDTSSLLAAILAQTTSVRVFADVGNLPLRPPAVFAKAAATLDLLSGGRFELGIGAGGFPRGGARDGRSGSDAGGEPRSAGGGGSRSCGRCGAESAAVSASTAATTSSPASIPAPRPRTRSGVDRREHAARAGAHRPGRRRLGSPLMNYKPPREAAQGNLAIDRAAREAGRDPREIRRIFHVPVRFASTSQAPATPTPTSRSSAHPTTGSKFSRTSRSTSGSVRSCSSPCPTPTRSPPSSRTSPRRCANGSASGEPPWRAYGRMTLPVFEDRPETVRGRMLYQSLLAVHAGIAATSPRWSASRQLSRTAFLQKTCTRSWGAEEERHALAVPGELLALLRVRPHAPPRRGHGVLRRARGDQPGDRPVVERLRADHRKVSDHLDAVEAAARALSEDESQRLDCRRRCPRGARGRPARPPRVRRAEPRRHGSTAADLP